MRVSACPSRSAPPPCTNACAYPHHLPWSCVPGLKFGVYAGLKHGSGEDKRTAGWKAVYGAIAATIAHVVTYPNDVLRRRLQLQGASGAPAVYAGYFDACNKIVRAEGWPALYRGLGITILRGVPNTGIQFGVYELCKDILTYLDLLRM